MTRGAPTIRRARPDDADAIGSVHVRSWRSSYRGVIPDEFLDALDPGARAETWRARLAKPEVDTFVAERGGEVVGFACGGRAQTQGEPEEGEVYSIYLLDEAKGQGVGRALFLEVCRRLAERGSTRLVVWVLEDNARARRFYQSLGGAPAAQKRACIGGRELTELRYDWSAIPH